MTNILFPFNFYILINKYIKHKIYKNNTKMCIRMIAKYYKIKKNRCFLDETLRLT